MKVLLSVLLFASLLPSRAAAEAPELINSVMRLNATLQGWNPAQPWGKTSPVGRRALAAIVAPGRVVTTAEMVANATYLEFETPDGNLSVPAKVVAVDYETNLALLEAADVGKGKKIFEGTRPAALAGAAKLGDNFTVYQVDDNGAGIRTSGVLQSVGLFSSFLPGQAFLTYQLKASMQSAASSFSLPVFRGAKLAGVLYSYNSKDQMCDVAAPEILGRFLKAAAATPYLGAPSLGFSAASTEDPAFRQWLKLDDSQGGIYLGTVRKGSAADLAGVKKGDVLLAVDGRPIDRRGYFKHPAYGSIPWGHLIRGEKSVGEPVKLSLIRDGKPLEITAKLNREEESSKLVPAQTFGLAPDYLVKGGFIFQELTVPLLESFGDKWASRAPLNLLDAYENPQDYEGKGRRVVFVSGVIPTPATVGYESLHNLIVREVNGKPVSDIASLVAAFNSGSGPRDTIRFDQDDFTIQLDKATANQVDSELLQRGIPALEHVTPAP